MAIILVAMIAATPSWAQLATTETLTFTSGDLTGWVTEHDGIWNLQPLGNDPGKYMVTSLGKGEAGTGVLRSLPFEILSPLQRFLIAGADGTADATNDGDVNCILLRSFPDGDILRQARPPGTHVPTPMKWDTWDLVGRKVFLEIVDNNP